MTTPPVDADPPGALLRQAVAEHAKSRDLLSLVRGLPYRDSVDRDSGLTYTRAAGVFREIPPAT